MLKKSADFVGPSRMIRRLLGRDFLRLAERFLFDEQFEDGVTVRSGQRFVFAIAGLTDLEILQKTYRLDVRGQRFNALFRTSFANVVGRQHELRERGWSGFS